jgi:hypothetical protein
LATGAWSPQTEEMRELLTMHVGFHSMRPSATRGAQSAGIALGAALCLHRGQGGCDGSSHWPGVETLGQNVRPGCEGQGCAAHGVAPSEGEAVAAAAAAASSRSMVPRWQGGGRRPAREFMCPAAWTKFMI